jgi:hypothetical protein
MRRGSPPIVYSSGTGSWAYLCAVEMRCQDQRLLPRWATEVHLLPTLRRSLFIYYVHSAAHKTLLSFYLLFARGLTVPV